VAAANGRSVDLNGVGIRQATPTGDHLDVAGLEEALKALVEAGDHGVAVLAHLRHVDTVERRGDAEASGFTHGFGGLCGMQIGLSGDAAAVQTRAAHLIAVDEGDRHAQLRGPKSGRIAARTRAEDDDVVGRFTQGNNSWLMSLTLRCLFS